MANQLTLRDMLTCLRVVDKQRQKNSTFRGRPVNIVYLVNYLAPLRRCYTTL